MQHLQRTFPLQSEWLHKNCNFGEKLVLEELDHQHVFLFHGSHDLWKTSLLFQAAVSYGDEGKHVVFICTEPFQKMPLSVHGMPQPNSEVMKHLKILYLSTTEELQKYLASVHMLHVPPDVLIINNVYHYAVQGKVEDIQHTLARLLTLITNAAEFLKVKSDGAFQALVGCDGCAQNKTLYERYISCGLEIEKVQPDVFQCTAWWKKNKRLKLIFEHKNEELYLKKVLYNPQGT